MSDSHAAGGRRLINATAVMASGTMISRILGLVRAMLIAFVLGNGTRQVEAFNFANTVPTTLYLLLAGGTLNNVLVPQIVRAVTHDEDGGKAFVDRIITGFVMILGVLTLVVTLATPLVMSLFARAWTSPDMADHWRSLLLMSYICMPQLFFYGVFFLIGQVLNARDRFGPMMWAPIANNVVSIGVFALYLSIWGNQTALSGQPFTEQQAWLLAAGSTLGIVVQTVIMLPYLKKAGFAYRPRFDLKGTGLGRTFHVAKWMVGYVALTTLVQMLVANLASGATTTEATASSGAGWTVYQNAYLIWILPHSLLTVSLATAMLPSASRYAVAGDRAGVAAETDRAMRLATTFLVPASVGLMVLADPITRLAFGNGTGAHDYIYIAWALVAFAIGLVPFTIQYLYLRAFFAMDNTRTPFLLQLWISGVNAAAALALALPWDDPSTVAARLALAYSLSYFVGVAITHRVLRRRLPELPGRATLQHLGRLLVATVPAAALAWGISWWFERYPGLLLRVVGLALAGVVAVLAFFFAAKRLRIPEATTLLELLRKPRTATIDPDVQAAELVADDVAAGAPRASVPVPDPDGVGVFVPVNAAAVPVSEVLDFPEPPIAGTPEAAAAADGRVLAERYRLAERLAVRNRTETWRAHDLVLGRAVLVHLLDPADPSTADVLRLSREAALATDARFLRVLDVVDGDDAAETFLVYEYAAGQTLEKVLRGGPLTGVESAWIVREVADALIALHAQQHYHRRLSPATLLVTASGNVKILGFAVNEADGTASSHLGGEATDVQALGQVLYACLVARWPGGDRFGLPAAPVVEGHWALPSQVRGGVAPAVDQVVDRLLSPVPRGHASRLTTAQDVTTQLSMVLGPMGAAHDLRARLHAETEQGSAEEPDDVPPSPVSTVAPPVPTPVASRFSSSSPVEEEPLRPVVAVPPHDDWDDDEPEDSTAPFVDEALSRSESYTPVPPPPGAPASASSEEPKKSKRLSIMFGALVLVLTVGLIASWALGQRGASDPATVGPLKVAKAIDFDPKADGGDADENGNSAKLAIDGKVATVWRTEKYRSAALGGLKPGVGLVLDLGTERTVTSVQLTLAGQPNAVQLLMPVKADDSAPMKSADQWKQLLSTADMETSATLTPAQPVTTRFLLVYLTTLPDIGGGYFRGGIAEVVVTGR
ncbi:MAG: murein biosynthesis integral membrane protein MurJ [Actinobacteria bacterium]|nr:murein biosynthesis integral membrane protein MurJ [Actinomycetota bacterium]